MAPLMLILLFVDGLPGDAARVSWQAWAAWSIVGMFTHVPGFLRLEPRPRDRRHRQGRADPARPAVHHAGGGGALLGEHIGWMEIGFSVLVVGLVALGSRMRVALSTANRASGPF